MTTLRICLGLMSGAFLFLTVLLASSRQGLLATKAAWVAATLGILAINPSRLIPSLLSESQLRFSAAALGIACAFFLLMTAVMIVFVNLPHERLPHYAGKVVAMRGGPDGKALPEVEFADRDGHLHRYVDNIAPMLFPTREFDLGEAVTVIAPNLDHPHMDDPLGARWGTVSWHILFSLCAGGLAAAYWAQLTSHNR